MAKVIAGMTTSLDGELHVDVMPGLLGSGLRLLEDPALADLQLEKLEVRELGARTSLRFRVQKQNAAATS